MLFNDTEMRAEPLKLVLLMRHHNFTTADLKQNRSTLYKDMQSVAQEKCLELKCTERKIQLTYQEPCVQWQQHKTNRREKNK